MMNLGDSLRSIALPATRSVGESAARASRIAWPARETPASETRSAGAFLRASSMHCSVPGQNGRAGQCDLNESGAPHAASSGR